MIPIQVKLLTPGARMPTRSHPTDAGWDLYAPRSFVILQGETALVSTGLAVAVPDGWFLQVRDRSSLAARGFVVGAGTIDSAYRGEVRVVLHNPGPRAVFEAGQRVAQFTVHRAYPVEFLHVAELPPGDRGEGAFGSSGR